MFAERVFDNECRQQSETGRISSLSFFPLSLFPLKVQGHRGLGGVRRGRGSKQDLGSLASSAPGRPAFCWKHFSFFSLPETPVLIPVSARQGGDGGSWVRLWEKKKWAQAKISGLTAQKRARTPRLGGRQPSQVPWHGGTRRNPKTWLAKQGWTVEPRRRGQSLGGRGGLSESHKLETEGMSGHLHFLPLLMGIISLALGFLEAPTANDSCTRAFQSTATPPNPLLSAPCSPSDLPPEGLLKGQPSKDTSSSI